MVHVWEQEQARAGVGCGGGAGICTCLLAISVLPEHRWLVLWVYAAGSARGGTQVRAVVRRQEAPPLPTGDPGAARNPPLPAHHRSVDPQVAFPAVGARGPAVRQIVLRVFHFEVFEAAGFRAGRRRRASFGKVAGGGTGRGSRPEEDAEGGKRRGEREASDGWRNVDLYGRWPRISKRTSAFSPPPFWRCRRPRRRTSSRRGFGVSARTVS